jgi:serine/threonine protein kinase
LRKAKAQPDNTVNAILRAGQLVDGKYRVERLLGEGGMAAVWAGTNERTGKRVALKVILRSLATTEEAQGLFHSEALAASRVNHPNVVTVFDVIEHDGMPCIVMELLDGEPLGSYIAFRGFLTVGEATMVLLPAMRGVAAAHAQGVIHRDLKPQNIFICIGPDGRVVTTKVLDFGISVMMERVMDRSAEPVPALAMGTPAYMSPEHLMGSARIDERADVYGFGVLLYEALTGQIPFAGQPGPELFHRILNDPPPPLAQLRPDVPPGLIRIIEIAMAKKPSDRYANLNLLLASIEDELAPATPVPRPITPSAGVPEYVLREHTGRNSSSAVQAVVQHEPSGQYPETRLFYTPVEENSIPVVVVGDPAPRDILSGDTTSRVEDAVPQEPSGSFPETRLFITPPVENDNQSVVQQEPSGQFPETQLFIGRPTEKDMPVVSPEGQPDKESSAGSLAEALPRPRKAERSQSSLATSPITVPLSGLRSLAIFQDRRWLLGAGCAVVLGFAVWIAVRKPAGHHKATPAVIAKTAPAASKPSGPPSIPAVAPAATNPAVAVPAEAPAATSPMAAVPAPAATNPTAAVPAVAPAQTQPSVAVPESAAAPPSSAEPSALAAPEHHESVRAVRDLPVTHRRAAAKNTAPPDRHAARRSSDRTGVALKPTPATTADASTKTAAPAPAARSSTKSTTPRAGTLSADDF